MKKRSAIVETLAAAWMVTVIGTAVLGLLIAVVNLVIGNYVYPYV
jgi:hypothetical protein